MCGVVGFIDFKKKTDKEVLKKMTDVIHHRGPDDSGYHYMMKSMATVGFGHRRLSILDLSKHGHQPMSFDALTIVYNGEVYNFQEIKKELESDGMSFDSNSDTEVILKSFSKWGVKAVDKFVGMFAFAIFDQSTNKCYIFRDRSGIKPLYYYKKDDLFLFGSELKSFHEHPNFKKEINLDALALFLQYGYILQPNSIFKDTYKLKAGHYLEISLDKNRIEEKKYWDVYDFYTKPKLDIGENEVISECENILKKAFNYRMVSDVPVGIFLSGGYDSSIVTALIQANSSSKINTFTIGFHEKGYDEAPYAKKVADYLGTNHTEYYCTQSDAKDILPKLVDIYDEPFGDNSAISTILVSQLAKKDVSVALSADGGDEIFAGYFKHETIIKFFDQYQKYPKVLRKIFASSMKSAALLIGSNNLKRRLNKRAAIVASDSVVELFKRSSQHYFRHELKALLKDPSVEIESFFDDVFLLDIIESELD